MQNKISMPVCISAYIRATTADQSFGVPQPPPPQPQAGDVTTTQRDYRFSGYHLFHDSDGNITLFLPPKAWLNQPAVWSRRQLNVGTFDLR